MRGFFSVGARRWPKAPQWRRSLACFPSVSLGYVTIGIPPDPPKISKFWVYVNMGVLSAVAGLIVAGSLNAATPKAGTGFELDAIGACFIGGASTSGGIGTVIGTIVGGFVMAVLNNGMSIMGVSVDWQQSIKGFVLLGAVCFDVYTKSRSQSK